MADRLELANGSDLLLLVNGSDHLLLVGSITPPGPLVTPSLTIDTWMTDSTLSTEVEPVDTVSADVPLKQWQPGMSPHRV